MTISCLCCQSDLVRVLVDFGPQPPSNRFERAALVDGDTHPLVIGRCEDCGLVQLVDPMDPVMVKSRFHWLTYNEPEGHLDDVVERLRALPGIDASSRIVGLTYKDDTTLARFGRAGLGNVYRYEPGADLGLPDRCAGLELVQAAFTPAVASKLADQHGLADLLLVRHVLEHAHDPVGFLKALRGLVRPGGYMLFEMPDCTKFIDACDYSFVWEEHVTYLASATLARLVAAAGLVLDETIVYPYPLEDLLIGIVRNDDAPAATIAPKAQGGPDTEAFARRYPQVRQSLQTLLAGWRAQHKRVAIFGAGHLAAKFVNLYALSGHIECVIDDHPDKQGLLMPGSRLPIRGSAALDGIDICLLALSPESQQKVVAKYRAFADRGGRFLSIFALNPDSIYKAQAA